VKEDKDDTKSEASVDILLPFLGERGPYWGAEE
jgi:hypothetical protein